MNDTWTVSHIHALEQKIMINYIMKWNNCAQWAHVQYCGEKWKKTTLKFSRNLWRWWWWCWFIALVIGWYRWRARFGKMKIRQVKLMARSTWDTHKIHSLTHSMAVVAALLTMAPLKIHAAQWSWKNSLFTSDIRMQTFWFHNRTSSWANLSDIFARDVHSLMRLT